MDDIPIEMMGPKMEALGDARRRRFAFLVACGTNPTEAARKAGYRQGDGARVTAHYQMHDQKVLDAILEVGRKVLHGLAPAALAAAKAVLQDKAHPAHARMIETVLDRTGFGGKTEHKVTVEHSVDVRELEALARRLALENGISADRLLGVNAEGSGAKVIEHIAVDAVAGAPGCEARTDDESVSARSPSAASSGEGT